MKLLLLQKIPKLLLLGCLKPDGVHLGIQTIKLLRLKIRRLD